MKRNIAAKALAALTVITAVSCQKEPVYLTDNGGNTPIRIRPAVSILTKAPLAGIDFPTERTLVVSAYSNGTSQNHFSEKTFTNDGDAWSSDQQWAGGEMDLLAYSADGLSVSAAYNTNVSTGVTLTVPDNSTAQTDILWGYKADATSGSAVTIPLRHAEAAVVFTASSEVPYSELDNTGITITGITLGNVKCSGKVSLPNSTTCTWSSLATQKTLTVPGISGGYDVPATAMTVNDSYPFGLGDTGLIVLPQSATSVTVTYTAHLGRDTSGNPVDVTGKTSTATLSGNWDAGKKYVYTLTFDDVMSIDASAYDWVSGVGGVPSKGASSATYSVNGKKSVSLPTATLTGKMGIDWGDGNYNSYSANGKTVDISHSYSNPYTGNVTINVMSGSVNFGSVKADIYNRFNVSDGTKVIIQQMKEPIFTVNSSGDQVVFDTGNLYWDGSKYQREAHQYDYPTEWNPNHVGHLFWTMYSRPYAESYDDPYAYTSDWFFAAAGGVFDGWTVLSKDEWNYVFSNHMGKRDVTIDGKHCAVLVPDGVAASVVSSSYTAAAWATAEGTYGLVALPYAGYRSGTIIQGGGSFGQYWSATPNDSDYAYYADFESSGADTGYANRYYGFSVRLVKKLGEEQLLFLFAYEYSLGYSENTHFYAFLDTYNDGLLVSSRDVTGLATWTVTSGSEYISSTGIKGKYSYKSGPGTATVQATYNGITARETIDTGWEPRPITVNSSGKKVKFAPGNLVWNGEKFYFEENQYQYFSIWSPQNVRLFFWSKDASVARAETYNDASANTGDTFFAADGGAIAGWTVLSKDEWDYVIANHLGKYDVTIDGKHCVVLVPDGVAASVVLSSYTAAEWATAEEQYGLVALPFAGYRVGTSFYSGGSFGSYWSATPNSSYSDGAYDAYFDSSSANTYDDYRYNGLSVRLVSVQ